MEPEIINHLLLCAAEYGRARDISDARVGKLASSDSRFFKRLRDGMTLTIRRYDVVMAWFSANWPAGAEWPAAVPRPSEESEPAAERAA